MIFSARVIAVLLAVIAVCSSCNYTSKRQPDVLVEAIGADPGTLNPILPNTATSLEITQYIYESLLKYDSDTSKFKPLLASSWSVSDDHLTYNFYLRKDVKWQDGMPFTANDVVFTFDAMMDKRVDDAHLKSYFKDLKSVKKVSDYSVKFVFSKPYFKALVMLAMTSIMPKHIFGDLDLFNVNPANRKPVGTGPYKFLTWRTGRKLKLGRFDKYYGKIPHIRRIVFDVVPNKITAFQLLKKGALDIGNLTTIQWTFQTGEKSFNKKFRKYKFYTPNYSFIAWNARKKFFSDFRVRKAMTLLVDRKKILKNLLFNQSKEISGPFYVLGKNYNKSISPYAYNPVEAHRLLKSAGWIDSNDDGILDKDGMPFKFDFLYRAGDSFSKKVGLLLKAELHKQGIVMKLVQLEWITMVGKVMKRNFDSVSLAFALPVQEDPYAVWHSSQVATGSNFFGFSDKRVDSLIEKGRTEFNDDKRAALYRKIHKILHEKQPCTFLFELPSFMAISSRFQNVIKHKYGPDTLEWSVTSSPLLKEW